MYKIIFFIFLCPLFLQAQDSWELFQSYEGRFSLEVPHDLIEKTDTIETALGKIVYHTFFFQPEVGADENLFYMLSYCDYPKYTVHSDSLEFLPEFFENTMDAATKTVKGELLYQSEVKYLDYPGRIWRIDYLDGKAVIKTKAYLIEERYYALQTISYKEKNINRSSERFLDSFRLLD